MARNWNESYAAGELPWDRPYPAPQLVELVEAGALPRGRALDIGCGTGTNARYLAEQGYEVVGIDLAPLAIEQAAAKPKPSGGSLALQEWDVLEADPPGGPFDLIFDRGCFHVFDDPADRARFAERVAASLKPGGRWVSLIGSTEGPARDHGPPRRSLRDIAAAVEPALAIESLATFLLEGDLPTPTAFWRMIAAPRATPAQPSTQPSA
ncbi:MAG: class I SAM-dependent methyltransferase [Planctomycetota bacterium]